MDIGQLRHKVQLQNYYTSRNSVGETLKVWVTYATAWAAIQDLSGSTTQAAEKERAETTHKIRVRYNGTISEQDRVVYDSRTFEVLGVVNDDTRKTYQLLLCKSIYPESNQDRCINAVGHYSELSDYADEAEGFVFLDCDTWLLYTRNSTEYAPSIDVADLFSVSGSYVPSTELANTSTIELLGSWDNLAIPLTRSLRQYTLTKVVAAVGTGTSLTFNLEERATVGTVGTQILTSDLTATASGASTTSFASPVVAAEKWIILTTGTGAAVGDVGLVTVSVYYSVSGG